MSEVQEDLERIWARVEARIGPLPTSDPAVIEAVMRKVKYEIVRRADEVRAMSPIEKGNTVVRLYREALGMDAEGKP